jgi:hypothetical protein
MSKHIANVLGIRADLEVTEQGLYFRLVSNNPEQEIARYQVTNTTVAIAIGNQTEYRTIFFYPATQIDLDKTGFYQMRCEDRNSGEPYVLVPMIYKPTFDSLTPEQVNSLIAVKVMGWRRTGAFWVDEFANMRLFVATEGVDVRNSEFNPYHSLDDCWKAEEKILYPDTNDFALNMQRQSDLRAAMYGRIESDSVDLGHIDGMISISDRDRTELFHMTSKQKCEAILRAIGEVV